MCSRYIKEAVIVDDISITRSFYVWVMCQPYWKQSNILLSLDLFFSFLCVLDDEPSSFSEKVFFMQAVYNMSQYQYFGFIL